MAADQLTHEEDVATRHRASSSLNVIVSSLNEVDGSALSTPICVSRVPGTTRAAFHRLSYSRCGRAHASFGVRRVDVVSSKVIWTKVTECVVFEDDTDIEPIESSSSIPQLVPIPPQLVSITITTERTVDRRRLGPFHVLARTDCITVITELLGDPADL